MINELLRRGGSHNRFVQNKDVYKCALTTTPFMDSFRHKTQENINRNGIKYNRRKDTTRQQDSSEIIVRNGILCTFSDKASASLSNFKKINLRLCDNK